MIGQFIRIEQEYVTAVDAVATRDAWHRVIADQDVRLDMDERHQMTTACRVVVLAVPSMLVRGLPGAGAVVCETCAEAKL